MKLRGTMNLLWRRFRHQAGSHIRWLIWGRKWVQEVTMLIAYWIRERLSKHKTTLDQFMAYIIRRLIKKPFWNTVLLPKTWRTPMTIFRTFKATTDVALLELVRIQDKMLPNSIPEEILQTPISDLVHKTTWWWAAMLETPFMPTSQMIVVSLREVTAANILRDALSQPQEKSIDDSKQWTITMEKP